MSKTQNKPLVIAVLAATNREQRFSHLVAGWVAEQGRKLNGIEIVYVDPKEFYFPGDGEDPESKDPRYTEIVARADGFLIVTPEYNHGYPGTLKRMLDSELAHYKHKAVAVCGASDGDWGGTRVVEALLPVLRTLGLSVSKNSSYFTRDKELFKEDGSMKTELEQKYLKSINGVYAELIWLTRALKTAREQNEN